MQYLSQLLHKHHELAIFLVLAGGFWVGNLSLKGFKLGSVTGVLLAGILVGQLDIHIPSDVESVFFLLFLFAIGYGVGPQFFEGLKKDGLSQALFAVILCCISLAVAWSMAKVFGFDAGTGAGLLSGANTSSAIIGVASDTITNLDLDDATKQHLFNHVPVAYAVTYIFGTAGTAWFLAVFAPKYMLGGNVEQKCRELEAEMNTGSEDDDGMQMSYDRVTFRAYKIEHERFNEPVTIKGLEQFLLERHKTVFIMRVRKGDKITGKDPDTVLEQGNIIAISADRTQMIALEQFIGAETADSELLNFPVSTKNVTVTKDQAIDSPMAALRKKSFMHGISIRKLTRGAVTIPIHHATLLQKGDVLEMVGIKEDLDPAIKYLGYAEKAGNTTDIVFLSIGIFLGGLIGSFIVKVGNVPLNLSTSGGALIAGLVFGWLRSRYPVFGNIPAPSQWLLHTLGLNVFIAVVGINASKGFVLGIEKLGINLFFAGIVVSILPMIIGLLLGRYVFKFHPAITLGACAGAHTETAALGAIQDALKSKTPALGYTVTYAVANTILATWGVVMVMLLK